MRKESHRSIDSTPLDRVVSSVLPFIILLLIWGAVGVWAGMHIGTSERPFAWLPLIILPTVGMISTAWVMYNWAHNLGFRRGQLHHLDAHNKQGATDEV